MPRQKKPANAKKHTRTPRRIAQEAVEFWYQHLVGSMDAHIPGDDPTGQLEVVDRAFDEIECLLEDGYVKEHGPIPEGEDLHRILFARESGYLIGVQVGLRLRGVR